MSEILSSFSVILVLFFFLLQKIEIQSSRILTNNKPDNNQIKARKEYNSTIQKLLIFKILPILFSFTICFYLNLPFSLQIINESQFEIWNFNALKSILIFFEFGVLTLIIYVIILFLKLLQRYFEK